MIRVLERRKRSPWSLAVAAGLALLATPAAGIAAELLMFEQPGCPWCRRWNEDVGPGYAKTPEGAAAPLRRLQLGETPPGVTLKQSVRVTPTFVVVDDHGREVGRITGYPGPDFFYGMLAPLLTGLEQRPAAQATTK